ncbi:hypothetical protein [Pseudanabaena sp. FACHB-2040]|uniref:hypothetical protein n=1 Tax=Pseudanabaena sp. FACHB-2040 TaxID=2692859 RepID=UPI0016825F7B|nr:hypothetical protein [Pseudanabaena sp. FACHB-2040]MBD2258493.1 hypothetical protein [Pseudanabaena sp. FACHB-2040]
MKRILLSALPLLVFPVLAVAPVQAQTRPNQPAIFVQTPTGPVRATLGGDKPLYLNNDTTYEYTLRTEVATSANGITWPVGTLIRGQFEPVQGGLRYVATSAEVNGRVVTLRAVSDTLHDVKDPRETGAGAILTDAAIGAAGGAVIGGILGGGIGIGEVIGGAAAGAVIGNVTAQRVVVIEPNQSIVLTPQ